MFIVVEIRAQPSLHLQPRTLLGTEGGSGHWAGTEEGGYQGDQQPEVGEWVAGVSESISWRPRVGSGGDFIQRKSCPSPQIWRSHFCHRL